MQFHILHTLSGATPDVIALQEASGRATLPGYRAYLPTNYDTSTTASSFTATLVHRNITAIQHFINESEEDYTLLEIVLRQKGDTNLFILNVYNPPKNRGKGLPHLLINTVKLATRAQLIIVGDFNSPHPAWGYTRATSKGNLLWQTIQSLGLTTLNNPSDHTRMGNSVCVDTSPDLSLSKNVTDAKWINTGENLGSDHYILSITFPTKQLKTKAKEIRTTDWDKFREFRNKTAPKEINNLSDWVSSLIEDVSSASVVVSVDKEEQIADSKLLHLWEAHKGLQKHNKRLREKITEIERRIEEHTLTLQTQQWNQICENMNGQLENKKTWHLLRHLLDPEQTRPVHKISFTGSYINMRVRQKT